MDVRRCIACRAWFPLTTEYFEKTGKGYLRRCCRACYSLQRKQKYAADPEPAKVRAAKWKSDNPERKKQNDKSYAERHPEQRAEISRRWDRNNPDKKLDVQRAYRKRNPGQNTPVATRWRKANPDKSRAIKLRRRARERELPAQFTGDDWRHALDYFGGCCAVCGRPAGLWHTLAADHWIPVTADHSPGTVRTNIVPLCHGVDGCNNSKSNREPIEWLIHRVGQSKAQVVLEHINRYFDTLKGN